ncbi:hypothetical protein ACHQM5_019284 [Ranunculus cassubicifolius]
MDTDCIDRWRQYFRTPTSDIFEIIENAITIAALDFPEDFRLKRDGIVEKLFLCQLSRCSGCDRVQSNDEDNAVIKFRSSAESECVEEKESQVSVKDGGDMNLDCRNDYSYREVEALTEELEEESQIVGEVLRIKEVLLDSEHQSEGMIIKSLQMLQLMSLTVETLQVTKIGMAVNHLRKHKSKCISNFARTLVKEWKDLVDQWCSVVPDIKGVGGSPESVNPSIVEQGLPSPPLDEGAFLATQTTSIELSRFFDGMDDDGNLRDCPELNTNCENERIPMRKIQPSKANVATNENERQDIRKKDPVNKQIKPSSTGVGPGRPPKPISRLKVSDIGEKNKPKSLIGESDQMKLEAAKRRLQNGYQQAENAKKQRVIQVMELHEIPKQGPSNFRTRPVGNNQNIASSRR